MAKKWKEPTVGELVDAIRRSFDDWDHIRKKGTTDPCWPDGTNMNLVRSHILNDQERLKEACRKEGLKKCPFEARRKPPRVFRENYLAPPRRKGKLPTMIEIERMRKRK